MVGLAGFEPTTPAPPVQCATKLRHSPMVPGGTSITLPHFRFEPDTGPSDLNFLSSVG